MKLSDFFFELPPSHIAVQPVNPRDSAKFLEVDSTGFHDWKVSDLPSLLKAGDLLVLNNTKVIPAQLTGKRGDATISVNLHKEIAPAIWKAFAKPAKRLQPGDRFVIAEDFYADVVAKDDTGEVTLSFNRTHAEFYEYLSQYGKMPLPPYIKRNTPNEKDQQNYQTVYAKHDGAVAAPTAGLHFTEELIRRLKEADIGMAYVTLHVGAGTFLPVKVENIADHKMHEEYYVVDDDTAKKINDTKKRGGRIIAVGTTSLRVLESLADARGELKAFSGNTSIFITPGYQFKITDMLMTNFHLPCSTLFMLVCAFAGVECMKTAYQYAIDHHYRFYSYGDSSLLHRYDV